MKPVLFAILGLVLGLGGGAAMAVMKARTSFAEYDARRAKVVADSIELAAHPAAPGDSAQVAAAGDSAHAADAPAADGAGDTPHGPTSPADVPNATSTPAGESRESPPARHRAVATVESHGGTRPTGRLPLPKPIVPVATASPGADKVARIFGAMQPKEAAKVLEQLTDSEVHDILSSLNEKQAAALLQAMPAPRAAAISKLALKGGHE